MTLASTISAGNLTKIRANKYQAQQFVVVVPDSIVVQFQASVAPTTSIYADITVGTVASGSMSNVKSFQTVIYSASTDYKASELYRTYVRKVSGTTTLYIAQTGQNLTTSLYVTVLNQYDIFEKPSTVRNSVRYNDYDVTFRRLLPIETALPTAVVLIDGATAWSPTAVPLEMDNDATSTFTHAWESSNGSDTLDSGGTTANPSWTLQANSFRWIRYTFTDSNSNANLRVMAVWTVPKALTSVVKLGFIGQSNDVANISYQQGQGWTCTIPSIAGISSMPMGQMICVFSIEGYNNTRGSIESNIDFVGYLGEETTATNGDPNYGRISETAFNVNGFGAMMANTPISMIGITSTASPSSWDDIENPTPARMITYLLTEFTTFSHLCAIKVPADHTDFIGSGDIFASEFDVVYDAIQYQADAFDGIIQYARDGKIDITRNLVQLDDATRLLADTVCNMTPADWLSYDITVNPNPLLRFLEVYAGVLNTTSNVYDVYRALVPPIADNRGVDEQQRVNVIITTDSTDGESRIELGQRAANLYAALNPTDILRVTLNDEWRFLQPDVGAWYTFTVTSSDNVRGWAYTVNTRWQLLDIAYTSNNDTGRKEVQATFRKETSSTGANIEVSRVVTDAENQINAAPGTLPPYSGGDLALTDGEWFDAFDTRPSSDSNPPGADCEQIGFRPKDGIGAETVRAALTGEKIAYLVSGYGKLQDGVTTDDDFTSGFNSWTSRQVGDGDFGGSTITSGSGGTYSGGTGWVHADRTNSNGLEYRGVSIDKDLGSVRFINAFSISFDLTKGTYTELAADALTIYGSEDGITYTNILTIDNGDIASGSHVISYSGDGFYARYINVRVSAHEKGPDPLSGSATVTDFSYATTAIYGDALYEWLDNGEPSAYDNPYGLLFELAQPTSIPGYSTDHVYSLYDPSVDSGALVFDFESPYGTSNLGNWGLQIVVCFLGT